MTGNYIRLGISDAGTFGSDGSADPAFVHDPTGTGAFNSSFDYIAPGTPHDGFSLTSAQSGFLGNDNAFYSSGAFGVASPTLLTGAAAQGYAHAASWTGSNGYASITNSYFFNDGDQRVLVTTEITALQNLTSLAFARSVDPDPDERAYGTYETVNQRGNSLFGTDDFIGSAGAISGLTLALVNVNDGGFAHTTQISGGCCSNVDPNTVLNHTGSDQGLAATGDFGLNLAYSIGTLAAGSSATISYAYAVGDRIESVGAPAAVPEPATWAMFIIGFGSIGAAARRRRAIFRLA